MLQLKAFQTEAAHSIVDRYVFFANHPDRPRKGNKSRPFFQALSAITGAGKTPILAEAVALMRVYFAREPIVFWMSKAKSVVAQTYSNFSGGGKYSEIVEGFRVINVSQLTPNLISDSTIPLLILATTGLFNNKDQAEGSLNIYKRGVDIFGNRSPWERLIERTDKDQRRPLLIVYDEGHNLSEQQTELLAELEPDAYLLASATMKLPLSFSKSVIQQITLWAEEASSDGQAFTDLHAVDEEGKPDAKRFITTAVSSEKVVEAELVKKAIQFDGTTASMEHCLDDLIKRFNLLQTEISSRKLGFKPKAIYVCKTNMADDGAKDDHSKPFNHRRAPPIRIWRYLVEQKGIKPSSIAIYADLKFIEGNKPAEVNLFSKGENDFDEFQMGNFQHIIFNLSLQEGWDDPACYLAYIDKSMGSSIQVEQVIGRVLRQYGAEHYEAPLLNAAHFFVRVDKQSVFTDSIDAVKAKLQSEGAPIEIIANFGGRGSGLKDIKPRDHSAIKLYHVNVDAASARRRIGEIISEFPTFVEGSVDTVGQAHTASQVIELLNLSSMGEEAKWKPDGQTNPVRLRWLVNSALRTRSNRALAIADFKNSKFDIRVQVQSNVNKAADNLARSIAEAFHQLASLVYENLRPYEFGVMSVPTDAPHFKKSLYERYSGMNKFELILARALDSSGQTWHRNSSAGGFHIPLLTDGDTASFYPDFLVWKSKLLYCLDTKGGHLLTDALARKLFDIQDGKRTRVHVRFITEGKQTELRGKVVKGGYTVWKMKAGQSFAIHFDTIERALKECLKP